LARRESTEDTVLKALIGGTLLTAALAILTPPAAQAADVQYCKIYAQHAVEAVSAGRAKPACAAGMTGARWSGSERVHFVFCMSNPISAAENMRGVRDTYLRSCGAIQ
jgi:hypothetical protein